MRIVTIYLYNTEGVMGDSNDATRIYPQVQIASFPYPFTTLKPFGEYINHLTLQHTFVTGMEVMGWRTISDEWAPYSITCAKTPKGDKKALRGDSLQRLINRLMTLDALVSQEGIVPVGIETHHLVICSFILLL